MNSHVSAALIALTLSALCAPQVSAQKPAKPPLSATVDLGFVNTAGNTDVTTLNGAEKVGYTSGPVGISQTFSVVYGRSAGVTNASDWKAGVRLDYVIDDGVGVFALGRFERNTFAGFTSYFEEAAGLTATLVNGGANLLKTEVGASLIQQRSLTDSTDSFIAGRVAATYRRNLTDAAYVQEEASALPNLQQTKDLRINSETSLVAPISKRIAVKLSYAIRFDNLPEPGFKKTDRIFTSGVQIVF